MKGMDIISPLVRDNIEELSGGRIASTVQIDGQTVRLIASVRRQKTVSASVRDGVIQLAIPMRMRDEDIVKSARGLIRKIRARQRVEQRTTSNPELFERALYLARVWLNSEVQPNSVVWSDRQTTLWGSCTTTTKAIRLSSVLRSMPQWVVDGVLVHELAHLKYTGHGEDFQSFAGRYPKMAEANAFLAGFTHGRHAQPGTYPEAFD